MLALKTLRFIVLFLIIIVPMQKVSANFTFFKVQFFNESIEYDTLRYSLKEALKVDLKDVKFIYIEKRDSKKKKLTSGILKFENLEILYLRPEVKSRLNIINSSCYIKYYKSKLKMFPDEITKLKNIRIIDLIGNPQFKYESELEKILELKSLEVLAIQPSKIDNNLIRVLGKFKQLKEIHIKYSANEEEKMYLNELKILLPKCKIGYSSMADYCDSNYHVDFN